MLESSLKSECHACKVTVDHGVPRFNREFLSGCWFHAPNAKNKPIKVADFASNFMQGISIQATSNGRDVA